MLATWIGASGGIVVFLAAIVGLLRGIFRQTAATDSNTAELKNLSEHIDHLVETQSTQDGRIKSLEDWRRFWYEKPQSSRL